MAFAHPNIKKLRNRTRLGSLQDNTQSVGKEISCRKRIFSDTDTDTAKKLKNKNKFEEPKSNNRRQPLQDIQNKNLGAIPKVINKNAKESKHKNKFEKHILKNESKIQTPKKPKPKKISRSIVEDESFKIPKFVTANRGDTINNSLLPDLLSDSFVKNTFESQEFDNVQILQNSGSNKENEFKRSRPNNRINLKRSRNSLEDDDVFGNKENMVSTQIVKRTCGTTSNEDITESLNIFSKTYLQDTILYYLYLEKPGKIFEERPILFNRTLNWLIQINDDLDAPPDVLLTAVYLFNDVLNKMEVSWCSMQLAGLACYRIVHKKYDATNVQWSIILTYLDTTLSNLNKMEQNILEITKFKTDIAEPSIFVYYYASLLQNYMNCVDKKIEKCVFYVIESLIFSPAFFTQVPSKIAATAMDLSFQMLKPDLICWQLLVGKPGYYGYTETKRLKMEMLNMLLKLEDMSFPYRSSYNKYSRVSNGMISTEIKDNNYIKTLISYC